MHVPLLDLKAQYQPIRAEIDRAVAAVFDSMHFINGPQVRELEAAIADYCAAEDAVGVSSGSDALLICLMVEGIGAGDEVITTDYSFFATAGCISRVGAKPVLVDIDPITCNIDPTLIEAAITSRTKAIIPVHLYGQCADMDAVLDIACRRNLVVIEDAAQSIGADYNGRKAGSMGDYGCFSFYPSKNLGGAGDGGIVTTNDPRRAELLRHFRNHGAHPKYYHKFIGGNFRLDTIQAAVVLAKLPHLDSWTESRRANAARYDRMFEDCRAMGNGIKTLPRELTGRSIYNQYVLRVENRDALQVHLQERGIGSEIYYPVPYHLQECFAYLGYSPGDFPVSEAAAQETIALPIYAELTEEQAAYVVRCVEEFYTR